MRRFNKALSLLLCLIMVLGMLPSAAFAADGEPNITISVDKTEVKVGDIITVKLGIKEMTGTSVAFGFDFDNTLLKATTLTAKKSAALAYNAYDPDAEDYLDGDLSATAYSTIGDINDDGHFGVAYAWDGEEEATYYENNAVITITFKAIAAGSVAFEMFEDSAGTDGYMAEWTAAQSVKINPSTAETSTWTKVTTAPTDWTGTYLIVYENNSVIFDGAKTDLDTSYNCMPVTISGDKITAAKEYSVEITAIDDGYSIQTASGYYIGQTSNANGLKSHKTTTYDSTITMNDDGTVDIISGEAYLRFNATSGQERFRYYKSSTYTDQQAICLYKLVESHTCGAETLTKTEQENAGCTTDGVNAYWTCSCGKYYADEAAATEITNLEAWKTGDGKIAAGHTYGDLVEAAEAIHTQTELKGAVAAHYFCDVCDTYFDADKNATTLEALTSAAPVHADENDDHKCDVCGAPLTKCADDMTPTDKKPAGCDVNGYEAFWTCNICGKSYTDAAATDEITDLNAWLAPGGAGYIPATGEHSFTTKASTSQATAADCNNAATYYVQCDNCDAVSDTLTVSVGSANGHTYGELIQAQPEVHTKDTLTAGVAAHYFCDICDTYFTEGKVETTLAELTGETPVHTAQADDGDCTTDITCSCGKVMEEGNEKHTGGEATCTKLAECTICGKEYGELDSNNHKNLSIGTVFHPVGDGTHYQWRGCSDCGEKEVEKVIGTCSDETTKDHNCDNCGYVMSTCSGGTATCTAKAQCSTCGAEYGDVDKNNHTSTDVTYTKNSKNHSATYDCCGAAYVTNEAHDYSYDAENHKCICGAVEQFVITMNANGGVFSNGASVYPVQAGYGALFNAVPADPTRDGYQFTGWNTAADGSGESVVVAPGTLSFTANITLYAQWSEEPACTHEDTKFVSNGDGTHDEVCQNEACNGYIVNDNVACSGGTATCQAKAVCEKCNTAYGELDKTNHTSDEEKYIQYGNSHAVVYACCNAHKRGENHTYDKTTHRCVCGALEEFKIIMNANGGKFESGADEIEVSGGYGKDFTAIPTDPTKAGSVLTGWNTEADGSGDTIVLSEYKFTENITVYAQWCDHADTKAVDNGDGTHTVSCPCGATSYSEDHSYDKTPGTCVCGVKLTGWIGNSYYENGEKVTGWKEVDGAWYYFGENGYCTGLKRLPYFGEYAPNAEDLKCWKDQIEKGETSAYTDAESAVFYFDEDGKLMAGYTGIVDDNGTLRYAVNGMIGWHVGFVKDGDNYYYFKGDVNGWGNVIATGRVYATRDCNAGKPVGGKCIYFFDDETGKLVKNEGIVEIEEVLYYFDSNNMLALGQGMVKLEDGYIYVRSSGKLALGNYWVTSEKANDLLEGGKLYDFGTDGCLTIDPSKNGIIEGVYYKEGVPYYAGLIKIGEDYYYVKSSGEVVTGWYYVTKTNGIDLGTTKLYFGKDGKMQPIKNGIVEENGELYYYEKNHLMCGAGLLEMEDENGVYYIYVRSSGKVQTGYFYITKTNDREGFVAGMKLNFGEDGKYYPGK